MPGPLSHDDTARITDALFAGRKIEAIKHYRECTGAGLKEAKDFVDDLEERLRQDEPGRFTATQRKGCGLSALCLLLGGTLALRVWLSA